MLFSCFNPAARLSNVKAFSPTPKNFRTWARYDFLCSKIRSCGLAATAHQMPHAFAVHQTKPSFECLSFGLREDPAPLEILRRIPDAIDPEHCPQLERFVAPRVGAADSTVDLAWPGYLIPTRYRAISAEVSPHVREQRPIALMPSRRREVVARVGHQKGHQCVDQGRLAAARRPDDGSTAGIDLHVVHA